MKTLPKCAACAALGVLLAGGAFFSAAHADPVYGTPAPLSGSRSVGAGLVTTGASDWDNAMISWDVVENGDGTNTITYTFTGFGILDEDTGEASQSISHVTIDISDDAVDDPDAITDAMIDGILLPLEKVELGDIDDIIGAVKLDEGTETDTVVYKFTTNREIVYGDVFVKSGQVSLKNTGFGDTASMNPQDYIARPNGKLVVPEPATAALGLVGALLILSRRRRFRV